VLHTLSLHLHLNEPCRNDIRKNTTYVDVFKGIRSVVDRLIAGGVQHIIISSIFYRGKPRGITSDEYNSKADQLNRFLHHYFQDRCSFLCYYHRFAKTPSLVYTQYNLEYAWKTVMSWWLLRFYQHFYLPSSP
jgi:hypothetical protein